MPRKQKVLPQASVLSMLAADLKSEIRFIVRLTSSALHKICYETSAILICLQWPITLETVLLKRQPVVSCKRTTCTVFIYLFTHSFILGAVNLLKVSMVCLWCDFNSGSSGELDELFNFCTSLRNRQINPPTSQHQGRCCRIREKKSLEVIFLFTLSML